MRSSLCDAGNASIHFVLRYPKALSQNFRLEFNYLECSKHRRSRLWVWIVSLPESISKTSLQYFLVALWRGREKHCFQYFNSCGLFHLCAWSWIYPCTVPVQCTQMYAAKSRPEARGQVNIIRWFAWVSCLTSPPLRRPQNLQEHVVSPLKAAR